MHQLPPEAVARRRLAHADAVIPNPQDERVGLLNKADLDPPGLGLGKGILQRVGQQLVDDQPEWQGALERQRNPLQLGCDRDRPLPASAVRRSSIRLDRKSRVSTTAVVS